MDNDDTESLPPPPSYVLPPPPSYISSNSTLPPPSYDQVMKMDKSQIITRNVMCIFFIFVFVMCLILFLYFIAPH